MTYSSRASLSPGITAARRVYLAAVALFAAAVAMQVFFAGLAVLVNPQYWPLHRIAGHIVGTLTIVAVIAALAGRLPGRLIALSGLLFLLFGMQYVFIETAADLGLLGLRAFHAVNALALFWLATHLTGRAWRLLRPPAAANTATTESLAGTVRGFGG